MTTPRYPQGCAEGSQVPGEAAAGLSADAWNVNFNTGNINANHRNNHGFALAVRRPGEFQDSEAVPLQDLYQAWRNARKKKKPSHDQLRFDAAWLRHLLTLQRELSQCTWKPRPATCFVAARPKAREIHAPPFCDRVVHHWLIPQLEAIYEPTFVHDSYANRRGKGSHAAVNRLHDHVRQVHSGQGGGWYLQLDIRNFFNSIHRPTLWRLLKTRMARHDLPPVVQRAAHALLRHPPEATGVRLRATPAELALVPPHKRLVNAPADCGLPIGNLSSQFLANVYLDRLDQFVKHELKAPRYVRYVDDFVLVHTDRQVLADWKTRIEQWLADHLRLRLKDDVRLRRLNDGVDFLGYILRPSHIVVRRRVVQHADAALRAWANQHVTRGSIRATPAELRSLASTWTSYAGHFKHAASHRLCRRFHRRYPWLTAASTRRRFHLSMERRVIRITAEDRSCSAT